jgi:hypothetical protein
MRLVPPLRIGFARPFLEAGGASVGAGADGGNPSGDSGLCLELRRAAADEQGEGGVPWDALWERGRSS